MTTEPQTIADARAEFLRLGLCLDPIPVQDPPEGGEECLLTFPWG
ncbi:hypothetical protein [Kineosporia succinea]|uniref:Uncharacterized protein n=1 Tax=Kineosporia succinea TaxID=84632 RepID=A0ABT9P268_9ACTN|nr:hypothetical protein [Kineosporia succinea]MDP9826774.1 hypothetical protein [Kineosporia succinea]